MNVQAYVSLLQTKLVAWNKRTLILRKEDLEPALKADLEWRVAVKPLKYEDATWRARTLNEWQALPNALKPVLPLSPDAEQILLILYRANLDDLARALQPKQVVEFKVLDLALYPILATAQSQALAANARQITAQSLMDAMVGWWTRIWPFCKIPKKEEQYKKPTPTPTK
jgi:hypothetical protein